MLKKFNKRVLLFINAQLSNEGETPRVEPMVAMETTVIYSASSRLMIMGFSRFLCIVVSDSESLSSKSQESCMDSLNRQVRSRVFLSSSFWKKSLFCNFFRKFLNVSRAKHLIASRTSLLHQLLFISGSIFRGRLFKV